MKRPPTAPSVGKIPSIGKVPSVRYDDIEASLATGDVLLFHGSKGVSLPIESQTHSPFSHAAMVIRPHRDQPPLVWQADPIPLTKDTLTNSLHKGAQISLLRENLIFESNPTYGDTPYLRQLKFTRTPQFETVAMWAIAGLDGTPFPKLTAMLTEWKLGNKKHIAATDRTFFCAELVAHTFMLMGLLPFDPPANAYAPGAFGARQSKRGPWLRGASLGPVYSLIPPPQPAAKPATAKTPHT